MYSCTTVGAGIEIVVDTSVLIAVIANKPEKPSLIQSTVGATLTAPSFVHWEIGNAFSAMLRRKQITFDQAQQALLAYQTIPVRFLDVDLDQALRLAVQLNIYTYDAYLIACAITQRAPLLTLDSGLRSAAQQVGVKLVEISQ
ncbi:MAG: twitching motility protein PilT [Herpetosiphonaceae bacterium]|nr:MAG: twitching motility protein PilT [Herpetosiphonaceae bacterium]